MAIHCEKTQKSSDKSILNENVVLKNETRWFQTCSPQYILLVVLLVASLLVSLTTLVVFFTKYQFNDVSKSNNSSLIRHPTLEETTPTPPVDYLADSNVSLISTENLTIVTRQEWLARTPEREMILLQLPVPYVIIMHTATENCSDQAACTFNVRSIQNFHMDTRGWNDIGYSFLVGGDGFAYEGRGWKNLGAHTYGYNSKSIGIAFIGNFNEILPPERQILAAKQLIQLGVKRGYIAPNYKLFGARQLQATQSPGLMLYEDIQKWYHWSERVQPAAN